MDLSDVNAYFIRSSLWPAIVLTVLMMLIGTIGNGLVLIIYRKDYQKSVTWIFIYFLSALDILTCLVSMPSELTILFYMVSFPSWAWCTISRYLSFVFHGSSCVILMAIAFNRYDRVCRPNKQRLNISRAKKFCFAALVLNLVCNIPSLIIYGKDKVPIAVQNNTARIITEQQYHNYLAGNRSHWDMNGTESNAPITEVLVGELCLITNEYANSGLSKGFFFFQLLNFSALVVLVIYFYVNVIKKMLEYKTRQESTFQLQIPVRIKSSQEPSSNVNNELSEDIKSDVFCKELTSDPLSKGSSDISQPKVSKKGHKCSNTTKDVNTCKGKTSQEILIIHKPVGGAITDDNMTGRSNIGHPVPGDSRDTAVVDDSLSRNSNPIETNKLLSRRIKSIDSTLNKEVANIPALVVPNTALNEYNSKEPLFLHASKTHKKRGQYESDKRDDRKCSSDEHILKKSKESKDDLYLHRDRQVRGCSSKSLEVLSPSCFDMTMTLNRRSHKGSSQCVLPISGLSVKSATAYDGRVNASRQEIGSPREDAGDTSHDLDTAGKERGSSTKVTGTSHDQDAAAEERGPSTKVMGTSHDQDAADKERGSSTKVTGTSHDQDAAGEERGPSTKATGIWHDLNAASEGAIASRDLIIQSHELSVIGEELDSLREEIATTHNNTSGQEIATVSKSDQNSENKSSKKDGHEPNEQEQQQQQLPHTRPARSKLVKHQSVAFIETQSNKYPSNDHQPRRRANTMDSAAPMFNSPVKERGSKFSVLLRSRSKSNVLRSSTRSKSAIDNRRRLSVKPIQALRVSRMLLIISLAFVCSFLPFWIVVILRTVIGESFVPSLSPTLLGVVSIFLRSTLVSNAVNPIVYGLINNQFRKQCKAMFCKR